MSIAFGPQLIGETEKTLVALLRRSLEGTGLTEPQWVTLRLSSLIDGDIGDDGLAAALSDRAHFADAADLVRGLTGRGLVANGRLTSAGRQLTDSVLATTSARTGSIWDNLPADDVAVATRVLNEVLARARSLLG